MRPPDPKGELIVGWQQQHDYLWARYADAAPWERVPQVMWRGRIQDGEHPDRDSLRWARRISSQGQDEG